MYSIAKNIQHVYCTSDNKDQSIVSLGWVDSVLFQEFFKSQKIGNFFYTQKDEMK